MAAFARLTYPIFRSITGDGVRETLRILQATVPLEIHEVPTGEAVLDWTVPKEWNVRRAWIKGPAGETVVDVRDHTLHLLGYSVPVHRRLPLDELQDYLHSLRSNRSSFPIGRPTIERPGVFVCLIGSEPLSRTASTRSSSTPPSRTGP